MGQKLPPELSKKNLIRDNSKMIGNIRYMERVMDEQQAANIQLELNLSALQKKYDELLAKKGE